MKRARLVLLGILGLLASLVLVYASARVAERGRFAAPYSTFGAGPDGTRALLLLTRALGREARPFTRELSHLPRGTLVVVAGCKTSLLRKVARPEREALSSWVEAGGLLIVAGVADLLPETAGLLTADERPCPEAAPDDPLGWLWQPPAAPARRLVPAELDALAAGPPLAHLLSFKVHGALPLRVAHDAEATELLSSVAGPLALTAPLGRGRVVLLGIPDALTNHEVSDGGGLVFARLLNAFAPPGPVLFDEYHLGMGERRSVIGYLRDAGYAPLLLQGLLGVVLLMFAGSTRLVPVHEPPARGTTQPRSFLDALANLYARTRDTHGALAALAQAARANIARHYQVRDQRPAALLSQLRARGLHAVALYVLRIAQHAEQPLERPESLASRARAIEQDETAATVIGELATFESDGARARPQNALTGRTPAGLPSET